MRTIDKYDLNQESASSKKKKAKKEETPVDLLPLLYYRPIAILAFALFCVVWWGAVILLEEPATEPQIVEKPRYKVSTYFRSGGGSRY